MEDELPDEILLKTPRWKTLLLLAICLAFVAAGVWLVGRGDVVGWLVLLFFGAGIPVLLVQLSRGGGHLRIDHVGIHINSLRKENTYLWEDLAGFHVVSMSGVKMVAIQFARESQKERVGRKFAQNLTGVEGTLPDTYGFKAQDLALLLNDYRRTKLPQPLPPTTSDQNP